MAIDQDRAVQTVRYPARNFLADLMIVDDRGARRLYIVCSGRHRADANRWRSTRRGRLVDHRPATKQHVDEWDMGKFPEEVTGAEWAAWFTLGFQVDPRTLDSLKKRVKAPVVFDISIPDSDSRIGRMSGGMAAALRRNRQEWVIREESAAIVKIITEAVKPVSLHRAVTEQMALTRNKPLKKDVYRFVRWLREFAIGHERFVGYEEEAKPVGKPDPPRMPRGNGQTFRPASAQAPPKAAPAPSTPQTLTSSTPGSGCLKCKSTTHKPCDCLKHMAGRLAKNVVTGAVVTVGLTPAEDEEHLVVV
ncbi:hypothetical protein DYB37_011073 [Aphanomyces astaci]|uniref:Uncharacterized protein n=1 Tax=Aphanomyces astaci TaxID=112090 RepID=A0A418FAY9_APHAT|nr:hypothetical protein DYB37_011073 [Aphanomyces astaci]